MTGTVNNSSPGALTSESHDAPLLSPSPSSPTTQPFTTRTTTKYYTSSSFFAQTFDAAAEHVKSEIAASEPEPEGPGSQLRRGRGLRRRRDSVHDEDGESMAGVVELRGFVADGWVGGLRGA
jgi:hypothetical protein